MSRASFLSSFDINSPNLFFLSKYLSFTIISEAHCFPFYIGFFCIILSRSISTPMIH
nr:MAG TPA: hypothetical protein [Bacteriophage sp.]DAT16718.1 MAG TPA: hypothetical protein [Caudoviricetes sp.]